MARKLRLAFFFLLVPGMIVVALPVSLGMTLSGIPTYRPLRYAAVLCWAAGALIARWCARTFFTLGQGTPSPADPPKVLVTTGLYGISRNPLYIGGILIVLGHWLYFQYWLLGLYLAGLMVLFQTVIVLFEEPRLRQRFGPAYDQYRTHVPRWLIRIKR